MKKHKHRYGMNYLLTCRHGIAIIRGEQHFFISDGYTRWLIVDFDPAVGPSSARFKVWS